MNHIGKIAIIGVGNVGSRVANHCLNFMLCCKELLFLSRTREDNIQAADGADVIFLAVRPQQFPELAKRLKGKLKSNQLVISLMAAVTLKGMEEQLGTNQVVRLALNLHMGTPYGTYFWAGHSKLTEENLNRLEQTLAMWAGTEQLTALRQRRESQIDPLMNYLGCTEAFVEKIQDALIQSAREEGVRADDAREIAELHFPTLSQRLGCRKQCQASSTPKIQTYSGMTTAILQKFESLSLCRLIKRAFKAGTARAREMGKTYE